MTLWIIAVIPPGSISPRIPCGLLSKECVATCGCIQPVTSKTCMVETPVSGSYLRVIVNRRLKSVRLIRSNIGASPLLGMTSLKSFVSASIRAPQTHLKFFGALCLAISSSLIFGMISVWLVRSGRLTAAPLAAMVILSPSISTRALPNISELRIRRPMSSLRLHSISTWRTDPGPEFKMYSVGWSSESVRPGTLFSSSTNLMSK